VPTWRRAATQGALLAVVYFFLAAVLIRNRQTPLWVDAFWAVVFFGVYTVAIHYWEVFLYRRRTRNAGGGKR